MYSCTYILCGPGGQVSRKRVPTVQQGIFEFVVLRPEVPPLQVKAVLPDLCDIQVKGACNREEGGHPVTNSCSENPRPQD